MPKRKAKTQFVGDTAVTVKKIKTKALEAAVKKVMNKNIETKSGYSTTVTGSILAEQPKTYNIMYSTGMTNGTGGEDSKYVGDSIQLTGVTWRGRIRSSSVNSNATHVTIALIKTPAYNTVTNIPTSSMFPTYDLLQYPPRFESSKVTVLKRMSFKLQPSITGQVDSKEVYFKRWFKKPIELKFNGVSTYQLKDYNYYLVILGSQYGVAASTNVGEAFGTLEVFYKDA